MNRIVVLLAALTAGACSNAAGRSGPKGTGTASAAESCDVTAPTACTDPSLRYGNVAPILETRCFGCHSGTPGGPWPLTSYEHVADWRTEIRAQMVACTMPPVDAGIAMPVEERERLLLWIRCGTPE